MQLLLSHMFLSFMVRTSPLIKNKDRRGMVCWKKGKEVEGEVLWKCVGESSKNAADFTHTFSGEE